MKIDVNAIIVARLMAICLFAFPKLSSSLSLSMMSSSASKARNIVVIGGGIQGSSVAVSCFFFQLEMYLRVTDLLVYCLDLNNLYFV